MTLHVGPLPAGDERHLKALEEARRGFLFDTEHGVAAYHRSLAEQGVRLVDASEVAEWLRPQSKANGSVYCKAFLARFGGGDEG